MNLAACQNFIAPAAKVATYTVSYDGNGNTGGTLPSDSTTYPAGGSITVLANTATMAKTGFTFTGWNTKADGSGTSYAAAATLAMGTSKLTLYAVWAQDLGGTSATVSDIPHITLTLTGQSATLAKGSSMTVTATPSASVESYAWYLDGALLPGQGTSTYSVGTSLTVGSHSLMSVVKKSGSLFSTTVYFVVK